VQLVDLVAPDREQPDNLIVFKRQPNLVLAHHHFPKVPQAVFMGVPHPLFQPRLLRIPTSAFPHPYSSL
jgi:hypothetical protein